MQLSKLVQQKQVEMEISWRTSVLNLKYGRPAFFKSTATSIDNVLQKKGFLISNNSLASTCMSTLIFTRTDGLLANPKKSQLSLWAIDQNRCVQRWPGQNSWVPTNWNRHLRSLHRQVFSFKLTSGWTAKSRMTLRPDDSSLLHLGRVAPRGGRCLLFLNDAMFSNS